MRVKLQKLELVDEAAIEALNRDELIALAKAWRGKLHEYQGILFRIKKRLFGPQTEKSKPEKASDTQGSAPGKPRGETIKQSSERYPDAPVREDKIPFAEPPVCPACGAPGMQDSGMTEDSEYLDVEAKEFTVVQQRRHKHRCQKCHGSLVTSPAPARVTPGGSYSDGLIVDATLSKYCDLIPMERYCEMAARGG